MEAVTVKNLSFRYPEAESDALNDISFSIKQGEFVTLCGISGSGKSTLLRQLKPAIAPHGDKKGTIKLNYTDLSKLSFREQSEKIVNEGGRQIKLVKTVKYMENGEIKTEINKVKI